MYTGGSLSRIKLFLCFAQITSLLACTFFRVEHGFNAAVKYQITLRSRDTCLQTCYDEKDCTFLEYDGVLCTIFKEGSGNQQSKGGEVFKLDRQRTISSCPSVVVVPPDIPFQTIQAGISAEIGSCVDVPNDATSIFIYKYNDATVFYSNRQGFLPNVTFPSGRFWLSKNPEPQCTAIPVFARASVRVYALASSSLPRLRGIIDDISSRGSSNTFWRGTLLSQISENLELFGTSRSTPVLLSFKIRFHKRDRGVPLQPKIDMAGLKDDECRAKSRQRVSIHVGVWTRKKLSDADSFTKCIQDAARETLPVLLPQQKFAFASAETKSTYNSVCVARSAGDFNQEKRLRRKLRRQLQQNRDNEWTSRAMGFEKAWEDRNPPKAYALLKQYSGKMKRCSPVLNTASGVAVAPSAPELEHVHRPTYAVNEEPPTESEILVCIQKMKNGKSGGDDGISAEMLRYLPPSGIREMKKMIRLIWIDERIPDSWRHAIIIPLHKKLSVTDPKNYRGISLLRVMYKVLERIILDRLIKHREETTRDEQAGFRPGRSTIDQVFIVRRVIEI
ncbi:hypothetical protein RB195_020013 [Necator americanus]|uniref:Apple domain-containing protein n=1 Tax=Necator americanus TaxID=51031 RepID=A0ABR1CGS7_NECAM